MVTTQQFELSGVIPAGISIPNGFVSGGGLPHNFTSTVSVSSGFR